MLFTVTLAAATAILGIITVALVFALRENRGLRARIDVSTAETVRYQNQINELTKGLASQRGQLNQNASAANATKRGGVASIVLRPGTLRSDATGNGTQILKFGSNLSVVLLLLEIEQNSHSQYEASLLTADGREIQRVSKLKAQKISSVMVLPTAFSAEQLSVGTFVVKLFGRVNPKELQPVDAYQFKVED